MRSRLARCAALAILFALSIARADELPSPLALSDVLEAVHRRNPEIIGRRKMAKAAAQRPRAAGWLDDPMVMVEWWQQPVNFSTVPIMVTLKQPIPWPSKLRLRREVGEREAATFRDDADEAERRALSEARRAYFDLVLVERSLAVNARVQTILEQLVGITDAQYRVGKAMQPDLLRAQTELLMIGNDSKDLERARDQAAARLNGLLDRSADSPIGPLGTTAAVVALPSAKELYAIALDRRPAVRRARDGLLAAESRVALSGRENYPEVNLWSAYMRNWNGVDSFTLGASTTLPIFSTPRKRILVGAAELEVEAARAALDAARRQADVDVRTALLGLEVASRHVTLHGEKLIPLADLTLESTIAAYQAGRVDFTTVLAAARAVRDHHLDHEKYLVEFERRRADLEDALGGDLPGEGTTP